MISLHLLLFGVKTVSLIGPVCALYLSYAVNMSVFSQICSACISVLLGNIVHFEGDPRKKI